MNRNKGWNNPRTGASNPVPPPDQPVPLRGTKVRSEDATQYDALSYEFKERAAIAEYDGQQTHLQAQRIAYLDAFMAVLSILPYEEEEGCYGEDWLMLRIKAAQNWLAAEQLQQPK